MLFLRDKNGIYLEERKTFKPYLTIHCLKKRLQPLRLKRNATILYLSKEKMIERQKLYKFISFSEELYLS